ncbi:MAG TPA: iron transporter [Candidatus Nanoarchaeia archaeon]|nr:iron transporter [Candidatus Nanoarchaeia archaeon]
MIKKILITLLVIFSASFLLTAQPIFAHEEDFLVKEIKPFADETHHLEVKPESLEGYRLPSMNVAVIIIDIETQEKQTMNLHPMFGGNFHYATNVALKPRQYLLKFHLDPPTFSRGDARKSQWLEPVEAEFIFDASKQFEKSVKIGNKETQDMKISFEAEHAESMFILESTEQEQDRVKHQANTQVPSFLNAIPPIIYAALLGIGFFLGIVFFKFMRKSS